MPPLADLSTSALLLIFAFGGYEVIPVPAGESKDPQGTVPFALIMTIVRRDDHPDAGADRRARHAAGAGRVEDTARRRRRAVHGRDRRGRPRRWARCSRRSGTTWDRRSRARAACSRWRRTATFRGVFAKVSPRFGTPFVAILFTAAVSLVLATTGSFAGMAAASAVSRLVVYVATCAAALRLRGPRSTAGCPPRR